MIRFIFILFILIFAISPTSNAEERKIEYSRGQLELWQRTQAKFERYYNDAVHQLYKNPDETASQIGLLRAYYARTSQYSPFANSIINKLTKYAFIAQTEKDREIVNNAVLSYKYLLDKHLANFDIISFAITMSHTDVRLGDAYFLKKLRKFLINDFALKIANIGLTPENAYFIVSFGEEDYILKSIGGVIKQSKIYNVGKKYYNVHDIINLQGKHVQIYMDITQAIENVKYNQAVKDMNTRYSLKRHL